MKRYLQSDWFRGLAVLVVTAGLLGMWTAGAERDKYEVANMTQKMKTVCVGRMLIDLPEEAQVVLDRIFIEGLDIATFNESEADFIKRLVAGEAQIRAKPDRLGGNKNMESVREVKSDSGLVGKIFVHGRTVDEGTQAKGLKLEHYRYENVALAGMVHANGVSIDLSAEAYDPALVENLPKLISTLVPNPSNRIPNEPGFCIGNAYFRDQLATDQVEHIFMSANLPRHPDLTIGLMTMANTKQEKKGLIERAEQGWATGPLAPEFKKRLTKLRAAPRTISGLTGDELVVRVLEKNSVTVFGFEWEVMGIRDNLLVPHLLLEIDTGHSREGPVPPSLSQDAAMAFWDQISSSVRVRPTKPPQVSMAERVVPPIGTYAWAGDTCPQSGWWQCSAGGDGVGVLGGQRQYIKQGQRLPQALLLPPQTLWEKVRGVQPSYEIKTPTSWKLITRRSRERVAPNVSLVQAPVVAPAATIAASGPTKVEQLTPVGSFAPTGTLCPASGWWQCEESHALDGTRWFAYGSLLPAATFAVSTDVFGKSANGPKVIQRRGTWRLIRYARAPAAAEEANPSA